MFKDFTDLHPMSNVFATLQIF